MIAHNAPHSANDGSLLQAPPEEVRAMRHIESIQRRIYAAMVKKLDDSVGDITDALLQKGILNNTIIVFVSDNGGMTSGQALNYASNWPLRGVKMSPYEGGVRAVALLWSAALKHLNHLWKGYIHVSDWLPTLLNAIGAEVPGDIDGVDLWNHIINNRSSARDTFFEIDDYTGYASITSGDYKLVTGEPYENYSNHAGYDLQGIIGSPPFYEDAIKKSRMYSVLREVGKTFQMDDISVRNHFKINCNSDVQLLCYSTVEKLCLFNIQDDPCEKNDLTEEFPQIVQTLLSELQTEIIRMKPRSKPLYRDPASAPNLHNFTWQTFY